MSTIYEHWSSLKRGDIIRINGENFDRIVSHVIKQEKDYLVVTFQDSYIVVKKDCTTDFSVVGFYPTSRDKELKA